MEEPIKRTIYDGKPEGFWKKDSIEKFLEKLKTEGKIVDQKPYYFFKAQEVNLGIYFSQEATEIKAYGFEEEKIKGVEKIFLDEEKKNV